MKMVDQLLILFTVNNKGLAGLLMGWFSASEIKKGLSLGLFNINALGALPTKLGLKTIQAAAKGEGSLGDALALLTLHRGGLSHHIGPEEVVYLRDAGLIVSQGNQHTLTYSGEQWCRDACVSASRYCAFFSSPK